MRTVGVGNPLVVLKAQLVDGRVLLPGVPSSHCITIVGAVVERSREAGGTGHRGRRKLPG